MGLIWLVGSNIKFQDIKVEPEVSQEFFIEQPIRIVALGRLSPIWLISLNSSHYYSCITPLVANPSPSLDKLPETESCFER